MQAFKNRPRSHYLAGAVALVVFAYMAATCSSIERAEACPMPSPGSDAYDILQDARDRAGFRLVYPCYLPNSQRLESAVVVGDPGRQAVSMFWTGPFEFTIRQSQFAPATPPDASGTSRVSIDLASNVRATLIERNDASGPAQYHLFWQQHRIYYELQAFGPPQQRRIIVDIARSLE